MLDAMGASEKVMILAKTGIFVLELHKHLRQPLNIWRNFHSNLAMLLKDDIALKGIEITRKANFTLPQTKAAIPGFEETKVSMTVEN